jgi:hypothetical protein
LVLSVGSIAASLDGVNGDRTALRRIAATEKLPERHRDAIESAYRPGVSSERKIERRDII